MTQLDESLPKYYEFAHKITGADVSILRDSSNWGTITDHDLWQRTIDESIAVVGVSHPTHPLLVGIGFLAGNSRHAILCDFLVHPRHRGQGIGQAILNRRINIADELEIPYLYTELSPTNKLEEYYKGVGFIASSHMYSRAARRHPAELARMAAEQ